MSPKPDGIAVSQIAELGAKSPLNSGSDNANNTPVLGELPADSQELGTADGSENEGTLLDQLDRRQNQVLSELDSLNDRVGELMTAWQAERNQAAA